MKRITRNPNPPECLDEQPAEQGWETFMQTECHHLLGMSLRREQNHLCCYCETQITAEDSHIEHMIPRSANPGRDYDYRNLAASCDGGKVEHCGRFKDDRHQNPDYVYDENRFCIPHDPETSRLFRYLINGDVVASPDIGAPEQQQKAAYMIGYLGLRCPRLVGRRREHARRLINTLGPNPDPDLEAWAAEYYLQPDQNGRLQSFHSLSKTILAP
jgi:uncharacterized protein (TIGR02646 family)